jgi:hypothetical protein
VIKVRSADINTAIRQQREGDFVTKALVQMHESDTCDPSMFRKNKKLTKKLTSGRRSNGCASTRLEKPHKKSRRSKY